MVQVAPSLLSADFSNLRADLQTVASADFLHLDIMDGHFVPNLTFGLPVVKAIRPHTDLPFDIHFMVTNPEDYVKEAASIGNVAYFTFHQEATFHPHRLIQEIKESGMKAGISLNPGTPVSSIVDLAADLDLLLIMSVNPGFGGQTFIPQALKKLEAARELFATVGNRDVILEVDGGVNRKTIASVCEAGAQLVVAGSAVFSADDRAGEIACLRNEGK